MATQVIRAATLREQLRALIQDIHSTGVDVHEAFRETGRQEANLFQELSQTLRNLDQLKSSFSRSVPNKRVSVSCRANHEILVSPKR